MTQQPDTQNFLSSLGFRFVLQRAPNVVYHCQSFTLPALTLGSVRQGTPFATMPWPGDKLEFGDLSLRFKIDEDMHNYLEIMEWMVALGKPESFDQYTELQAIKQPILQSNVFSDATLLIESSQRNVNKKVLFRSIFPISLAQVDFDVTQTTVDYLQADIQFKVLTFTIE